MTPLFQTNKEIRQAFRAFSESVDKILDSSPHLISYNQLTDLGNELSLSGSSSSLLSADVSIELVLCHGSRLCWEIGIIRYQENWLDETHVIANVYARTDISKPPKLMYPISEFICNTPDYDEQWPDFSRGIVGVVQEAQNDLSQMLRLRLVPQLWEMNRNNKTDFPSNPFFTRSDPNA